MNVQPVITSPGIFCFQIFGPMVTIEKDKLTMEVRSACASETWEGIRAILVKMIVDYFTRLPYTPSPDSIAPIVPALQLFTHLQPNQTEFQMVFSLVQERTHTLEWLFGMNQDKAAKEYWERLEREKEEKK